MSSTREIITIQAGNGANFIGTHWWNLQESSFSYDSNSAVDINHDVMFREGLNLQHETTYTPRLILIDLDANLKSIRKECPLYRYSGEDKSKTLWDGPVEVIKEEPIKRNSFLAEFEKASVSSDNTSQSESKEDKITTEVIYDLNSSETIWSDFLKTNLHPKSFCLFGDGSATEEKNPFDLYGYGEEVYEKGGSEKIEESIRWMTEECDYLQGFHLLFDAHNGFSGMTSHILGFLDDEYNRQPKLCFPVYQGDKGSSIQDVNQQSHRLYATLVSSYNMYNSCSIFSPLCLSDDVVKISQPFKKFPFIHYNASLLYHTSAIFAASIETVTSPYRMKNTRFNMSDVTSAMSMYNRKLVSSSVSLPFPLRPESYLNGMMERDVSDYYLTSLTPFFKPESERTLFQSAVLRGVPENRFQNQGKTHNASTPEEIFGQYLNKYSSSSVSTVTVFNEKCCVVSPFPNILKIADPNSGQLNTTASFCIKGVDKVPMAASFSSSDSAADFIEDLISQANKRCFKEYVKSTESSYERDNYQEVIEGLVGLQDCYKHY